MLSVNPKNELSWWIRAVYWLALLGWFAWRLPRGADVSDEGYYTGFYVAWLRGSIAQTGDMSAHQPTHLIAFPFVLLFSRFVPDLTGLMLFLRILFACFASITIRQIYVALRHVVSKSQALCIASLAGVFFPFSLPAPCYNAMGMLFSLATMCCLLDLVLNRSRSAELNFGLFASLTGLAYPTLLPMAPVMWLLAMIYFARNRELRWSLLRGLGSLAFFHAMVAVLVVMAFGFERLHAIAEFARNYGAYFDAHRKLYAAIDQLIRPKRFLQACLAGLLINTIWSIWPSRRLVSGMHAITLACLLLPFAFVRSPIFMFRGHEVVVLFAIMGLPTLRHLFRSSATPAERLVAIWFGSALVGGFLSSWTSSNSLWNFVVGGFGVVPAVLADWCQSPTKPRLARHSWPLLLITLFIFTKASAVYFYGENHAITTRRIKHGIYAHLLATPETAARLERLRARLQPLGTSRQSCCFVGAFPGFYLLTDLRLLTPHSWPIPLGFDRVKPVMQKFFADRNNLADYVIWYVHPQGVNDVQREVILREYVLESGDVEMQIYRRKDLPRRP